MLFNTIDEYYNELTYIESRMRGIEERMKQYPERRGISINYKYQTASGYHLKRP